MKHELHAEIRRLYFIEKLSCRQIEKRLKVSRKCIRKAIKTETTDAGVVGKKKRPSMLDPYKERIRERVKEYPELSGVRVCEEIKQQGFQGEVTIVRDYLREVRGKRRSLTAYLRLETLPGMEAQCDWASFGHIEVEGVKRALSCFVMVLSYSRYLYADFMVTQEMEAFLRGHEDAFRHFGGIPKRIIYDNLKSVVLSRYGGVIRFNERFMDFASHYLFEPVPARVRTGQDKGKVERVIRYLREGFFAGRSFTGLQDMRTRLKAWLKETANTRIHATTGVMPVDRLEKDRSQLIALPERSYDCTTVNAVTASSDCRVRYDGNIYSVPFYCANKALCLRISPVDIRIYQQDKLVATHRRSFGRRVVTEDPSHLRELIKTRGRARGIKAHDELNALGDRVREYIEGLLKQNVPHYTHIEKLIMLRHMHGKTRFLQAVEKALLYRAFGAHYIERIIMQDIERSAQEKQGELLPMENKKLCSIEIDERNPEVYDNIYMDEEKKEEEKKHE